MSDTSAGLVVRDYRQALGQYPTGVIVITTRGSTGSRIGVTANSFTSVSLDPPLISWSPSRTASDLPQLTRAPYFAVNVLAAEQRHLARRFALSATQVRDKFEDVAVTDGIGGLPLIEGAVARFECRTVRHIEAGDHLIILGEVRRYDVSGGTPLVFHSGDYHVVTSHPGP
ncbi:flavin reductase family protein [Nocardioides sp. LHG3406-4]|uniref:flavin reductase family protein n=1 Tax=Nocardioides sp. LHG3406-4 TaxID=2804575 RepID=UPI003CE7CB4C